MNKLLKTPTGRIYFSWKKTVWLYTMALGVFFIDLNALRALDFSLFFILLITTVGFGHSVGLHRGVIHKSYKTSKWFRNTCLFLFVLTGMGSPLAWLKQHYYRDYWQNRLDCPRYFQYKHSLFRDYIWNLHLHFVPADFSRYKIPKEDLNDRTIVHLHKTWYLYYLSFIAIVGWAFGINTMLFIVCFRTILVILGHWYIGYASHRYGYARYSIKQADESGFNDVFLGLLSFGEGFHNNHHSHPTSAKFSMRWYEVDLGWYLIILLKKLGIIYEVNTHRTTLKETAIKYDKVSFKMPWQDH